MTCHRHFFSLVTTPRDLGSGEKKHLVRSAGLWKSEVDADKLITLQFVFDACSVDAVCGDFSDDISLIISYLPVQQFVAR